MRSLLRLLLLAAALSPLVLMAAVETWTTPDGAPMQAEFLGLKGDYASFRKADGGRAIFPLAKLTPADRARIAALTGEAVPEPRTAAAAPAQNQPPPAAKPSPVTAAFHGKLVGVRDGTVDPLALDHLVDARAYAFYYSASWCGPCRQFTPELVTAYHEIKKRHPDFEIVFISSDRDEKEMKRYMLEAKMPWAALRFRETKTTPLAAAHKQAGIPNLVFLDRSGKVLSKSFDDRGQYLGPQKVLADIRRYFGR